jgi:amino-acid N-acetyltransferase
VAALVTGRGLPVDGLGSAWRTWVATDREQVVGTASLERHDDALLLRGVAVAADRAGAGIGARLVGAALLAADGIGPVALLTETAAAWFPRFGFTVTTRDQLPAALAASPELRHACPASATAMIRRPAHR